MIVHFGGLAIETGFDRMGDVGVHAGPNVAVSNQLDCSSNSWVRKSV